MAIFMVLNDECVKHEFRESLCVLNLPGTQSRNSQSAVVNVILMSFHAPYRQLSERAREIALLAQHRRAPRLGPADVHAAQGAGLPRGAVAYFSGRAHRLFTAPEVGDWIADCEDAGLATGPDDPTSPPTCAAGGGDYDRATQVPAELVEEYERAKVHRQHRLGRGAPTAPISPRSPRTWKTSSPSPAASPTCGVTRPSPYDALLEGFEPGARAAELDTLFATLRPAVVELLGPATERSARVPADLLAGPLPRGATGRLQPRGRRGARLRFRRRAASTPRTHPFCNGLAPGDCRLTTRYDEGNFLVSLYGVMHEAGHGMYEQGLPPRGLRHPGGHVRPRWASTNRRAGCGKTRSAARASSGHTGCRAPSHYFPHLAARTPEEMFAAVNRVRPSFIRVEADQVTYDLHIILRFGLERRILDGELAIRDMPAAWNEAFEQSFGLPVPDDAHGCLQDIHWSEGLIGYFPTYTLGNLNAAQLFRRALADLPRARRTRRRPIRRPARLAARKSPRPRRTFPARRTHRPGHRRADPRGILSDGLREKFAG